MAAFANSPILDCADDTPAAQLLDWLFPILVQQSTFSEETLRGAFGYLQKKAEGSNAEGDNLDLYTRVKAVIGFCLLSVVTEKWQTL